MTEKEFLAARFPLSGTFELTARCSLRCGMCFIRVDEPRIRELGRLELTATEWIEMGRQAAEMGTLNLLITGGEPMLRPDFPEIWEALMGMGFMTTLYTNATLVTPEIRALLTRLPPHRVGVTLYGASRETYAATCGSAEGYNRTLEGITFFKTLPSRLDLRTTVVKSNRSDLNAIRDYAESLGEGVGFTITNLVSRQIRGGVAPVEESRLSPDEQIRLYTDAVLREALQAAELGPDSVSGRKISNLEEDAASARKRREHEEKIRREPRRRVSLLGCGAGMDQYCITWDGRLLGCQMLDSEGTDALGLGLRRAWEEYPATIPPLRVNETCRDCEISSDCMACPATRLAESGDLSGVPEYSCRMAHLSHDPEFNARLREEIEEKLQKAGYPKAELKDPGLAADS